MERKVTRKTPVKRTKRKKVAPAKRGRGRGRGRTKGASTRRRKLTKADISYRLHNDPKMVALKKRVFARFGWGPVT